MSPDAVSATITLAFFAGLVCIALGVVQTRRGHGPEGIWEGLLVGSFAVVLAAMVAGAATYYVYVIAD